MTDKQTDIECPNCNGKGCIRCDARKMTKKQNRIEVLK